MPNPPSLFGFEVFLATLDVERLGLGDLNPPTQEHVLRSRDRHAPPDGRGRGAPPVGGSHDWLEPLRKTLQVEGR